MTERFTIKFEPTGAGVLVTVPEIGTSTMAEDASIRAIEAAGHRLIEAHVTATHKRRRGRRTTKVQGEYTPRHRDAS